MWTPKRVVILLAGFALFLTGYVVYAFFLGGIDGLPALPEVFGLSDDPRPEPKTLPIENETDRKLRQAFGPECNQVHKTIKLEIRKRGLVIAADAAKPTDDGKLRLEAFSVAIFNQDKNEPNKFPEINTVQSDVALIAFDSPITSVTDIGNRKIVGGELSGNIVIVNNRKTPAKSDDVEIRVDEKPLVYEEPKGKVWTVGHVQMLDKQTRPHPTMITGKGMDLLLAKELTAPKNKGGKPAPPKQRNDAASGVDEVILHANVEMHLYPDSNSGFLNNGKEESKAIAAGDAKPRSPSFALAQKKKQEKSHVLIKTAGRFHLDVVKDVATFESPCDPRLLAEHVHVLREPLRAPDEDRGGKNYDQLWCDFLKLQFRRKEQTALPGRDNRGMDREIESAYANCRPDRDLDQSVLITIDAENLHAFCSEMFYHSPVPGRGPQTVLKGDTVHAVKDGHKITCKELLLTGADPQGKGQLMKARGPGQVDLFDRTNEKNKYPVHALWKDWLTVTKDALNGQEYDLLTMTVDASFIDEQHEQDLHAQTLRLWLEPPDRTAAAKEPAPKQQTAATAPRQRPHKLVATNQVRARSPELIVHKANLLTVLFEDGTPALPAELPHAANSPGMLPTPSPTPGGGPVLPDLAGTAGLGTKPGTPVAPTTPSEKGKERKPLQLWARDVTAYVTRLGQKNELRELITEGSVHVQQEGKTAEDKGVDIRGEILTVDRFPGGDVLKVFGDPRGPQTAQLMLNDLYLEGPTVEIDQQKNTAFINGLGVMSLPSNTTFEGGKPARAGVRLVISWTKEMLFTGQDADFQGGVVATQDKASLKCKTLQVKLDKFVSFKEGQKGEQSARVEKMVANGQAYVVDHVSDTADQFVRMNRLTAHEVAADNKDGKVVAVGPGTYTQLQYGTEGGGFAPGAPPAAPQAKPAAPAPAAKKELNLTRVKFQERMWADNPPAAAGENKGPAPVRKSTFRGGVEVLHMPVDQLTPDVVVEKHQLPKGAMHIECGVLQVHSRPQPDGKNQQEMQATDKVSFRTQEFYGKTDVLEYYEQDERVVFKGTGGRLVTLYQVVRPGQQANFIQGRTIIYQRKTGEFNVDGVTKMKF